jgi:hypothetical protein
VQTLKRLGLQRQAQEKIYPILVEKSSLGNDADSLLTAVANSFDSENEKAQYFTRLCKEANYQDFTEKIIQQNLIGKDFRQPIYENLIKYRNFLHSDYEFEEISQRTFSNEDAEEIYDHEKDFKLVDEDSLKWQHEYLDWLIEKGKTAEAKRLILQIESDIKGKTPRPVWLRLGHLQIIGGSLQRFVGIEVTDNVPNVKLPNIERLNGVVAMLKRAKKDAEAEKLTVDFYSRMLALEQYETANFVGLAKAYFQLGDNENAVKTLQKLSERENFIDYNSLAEIYAEFGIREKELDLRRKLLEISPFDFKNMFDLARLLPKENAVQVWQGLVNDRNVPRLLRWRAIEKLHEAGEIREIPNNNFDAYSQFYNGEFLNSIMLDNGIKTQSYQQLIKFYANSNQPFAALKLTEIDKSAKNDELLDLLSKSAEKVGEFGKAIEFEKAKSRVDEARIKTLQNAEIENNKRVTDFAVDAENTRKL